MRQNDNFTQLNKMLERSNDKGCSYLYSENINGHDNIVAN